METRANFVLIGTFVLAVIAAAFGFVLWFQNLHSVKLRSPLRIVFEGSASGLRNGGNVNFNGIRVGEVVSVKIDNPKRVVALAMVENNAPIRKDTLVGLEFQGLTGVSAISLKGGDPDAAAVPLDQDGVPVLTADPNSVQDISEAVKATLQNVNRIISENQESVKNSLRNVEAFSATLARNSEVIDGIMLKIDSVMGKTDGIMGKADAVVARTDNILLGLDALAGGKDGGELTAAVKSFHELTENLDKRSGALMLDGRRTLGDISRAVNNLDRNPTRLLFGASNSAPAAAAVPAAAPAAIDPVTPTVRRRRN
jgi:phospholipid/cholesterol/gamma-HCH transport system substrate-binding protein